MNAIKTTKSGKVKRAARTKGFHIKMTAEELERYGTCLVADAAIHGGEANGSATARALIRQWCDKIEAIASSETAKQAAKTLRRKAA